MVTINVLVITYNQEKIISRALDSVLSQKEWGLKEIIICDDNSTDGNWNVIQSYVERYPEIIKAYRNEPNLGIIRNVEKVRANRGSADLFIHLAGDDAINEGYFKEIQKVVSDRHIDVKNDAAIILAAYKSIRPDGKERIWPNSCVKNSNELFRLKYRNMVSGRGMLVTSKVISKYKPLEDVSNLVEAEELCDIQSYMNAEKSYYTPYVGNIYYTRIGISTTMQNDAFYEKYIAKFKKFLMLFDLCEKDKLFTEMKIAENQYFMHPSVSLLLRIIVLFFRSYDFKLGINKLQFLITVREIVKHTMNHHA